MLPLAGGYYGFCALAAGLSVWLLLRVRVPRWCILAGLVSPLAMWNLYIGQLGMLCGAILFAGLAALPSRPVRAGILLALLCIKPQFAVLVPVVVLASRNWRAACAGAAALALILLVSLGCFGTASWLAYLGAGRGATATLLADCNLNCGVTVFWTLRSLNVPLTLAYAGQAASTAFALLACCRLWSRPAADALSRVITTVFLTFLAAPYALDADLSVFCVLLPMLFRWNAPWRNAALAWIVLLPAVMPQIDAKIGFLPTPLLILAGLGIARTMRLPRPEHTGDPAWAMG
jgi:hypothetical protein